MPEPAPDDKSEASLPEDLAASLGQAGLAQRFASLPPSHRREYLKWIEEAKKPETRRLRIEQAIERIKAMPG